jgi:hypothetical protein
VETCEVPHPVVWTHIDVDRIGFQILGKQLAALPVRSSAISIGVLKNNPWSGI